MGRFDIISSKERSRALQEENKASQQADINQLPPGYSHGFDVRMNNEYKVIISSGITSVWGQQVSLDTSYTLSDYDFVTLKTGPYMYYIYLTPQGEFKVDRGAPEINETQKGYCHTVYNWRCIGKLWVSTAGLIVWAHTGAI